MLYHGKQCKRCPTFRDIKNLNYQHQNHTKHYQTHQHLLCECTEFWDSQVLFCRNQKKLKFSSQIKKQSRSTQKKCIAPKQKLIHPFDNNRASAGTKVRLLPYLWLVRVSRSSTVRPRRTAIVLSDLSKAAGARGAKASLGSQCALISVVGQAVPCHGSPDGVGRYQWFILGSC